jgi:hypothetical protein
VSKKKNRRDKQKFPNLDVKYNLKSRRDYLDNRHYVNGVKHKGNMVMPPLTDKQKKFLNDFNKEYYNASFDSKYEYATIHVCQVDENTVKDIKDQIRTLKKERKKIFDKSPNTTTEQDRELAEYYTGQIEDMEDFLNEVHPRRACEHANNARNYDLLNMAKASNEYDLVSWEELEDDDLVEYNEDIDPDFFNIKIEDD